MTCPDVVDRLPWLLNGSLEDDERRSLTEQGLRATIWGGVASYPAHALGAADLFELAEAALESARDWRDGRIEVAIAR